MFGLFNSDPKKKLQKKYKKLMEESHALSHKDRKAADQKMQEADDVLKEIEKLDS
ncbi:Lacal_2735 family protein [Salibacter sp.]|uniref:Lacal_2735 family protein n=1 Tax=Salibacter sp. TaxID=2010995 RepID=UPI002870B243|nr:Lacal_2735 family protein [Salibacter sp.]MDR9397423.1 Lacal_2735 family protein [Salibacter sp.]MDR9486657.1 Lacal_2735 family protein [Salibacter sp.]